jgi:dihydrofolate reductase
MTDIRLLWAQAQGRVIGRDGDLPWHLPEDLAQFKRLTTGQSVLMGRATWQSLPPSVRPLPGRRNLVLSRDRDFHAPGAEVFATLEAALAPTLTSDATEAPIWVIGGSSVYAQTLGQADSVLVTEIDAAIDGDCFAPELGPEWAVAAGPWQTSITGLRYRFSEFNRH